MDFLARRLLLPIRVPPAALPRLNPRAIRGEKGILIGEGKVRSHDSRVPGEVGVHSGLDDPFPRAHFRKCAPESKLECHERMVESSGRSAQVKYPRAGRSRPAPDGIQHRLQWREAQRLVPYTAEMILHDSAVEGKQSAAHDAAPA